MPGKSVGLVYLVDVKALAPEVLRQWCATLSDNEKRSKTVCVKVLTLLGTAGSSDEAQPVIRRLNHINLNHVIITSISITSQSRSVRSGRCGAVDRCQLVVQVVVSCKL
jgi:hypothetical protein